MFSVCGKETTETITITPEMRKLWISVRSAWARSHDAFSGSLSALTQKQVEQFYDLVKHSLYMAGSAAIVQKHPELREFLKGEDDRLCMHDIYEVLSWKLGRSEPVPKEDRIREAMRGGIGRSPHDPKP